MKRVELLQEIRKMRFKEVYTGWNAGKLTQEEAVQILGVSDRTFRRHIHRYEENRPDGLLDKRITAASYRRAPVDEVLSWYQRDGGSRSYSWVKQELQKAGLVKKAAKRGKHRKKRERMPLPGMIIHQDGAVTQRTGSERGQ